MTDVVYGVKRYFTDLKYFNKPEFISKSYNLHFYCSILIGIPIVLIGLIYMGLDETPFWFHMILGGFILFGINFVVEWVKSKFFGIERDFTDINFGSYGGLISSFFAKLIYIWLFF